MSLSGRARPFLAAVAVGLLLFGTAACGSSAKSDSVLVPRPCLATERSNGSRSGAGFPPNCCFQ